MKWNNERHILNTTRNYGRIIYYLSVIFVVFSIIIASCTISYSLSCSDVDWGNNSKEYQEDLYNKVKNLSNEELFAFLNDCKLNGKTPSQDILKLCAHRLGTNVVNKKYSSSWLAQKKAQITDEILEGLASSLTILINDIFNVVDDSLFNENSMSFHNWDSFLGMSVRNSIVAACQVFGAIILLLLLLVYIIQFIITPRKQRSTTWTVAIKALIIAFLIYYTPSAITKITAVSSMAQTFVFNYSENSFEMQSLLCLEGNSDEMVTGANGEEVPNITYLGIPVSSFEFPLIVPFIIVLALIFSWNLIKQFFRYLVEMMERYVIYCILLFLFPAVVATYVIDSTENIFKAYLRMLGGQIFLLLSGGIFLKGFAVIVATGSIASIPGYIFTVAYLRVIQRLDSYLNAMGLNIAQTSGGLVDALGFSLRSIGNGFRKATGMANGARVAAGGLMKAFGVAGNNQKLFNAGSKLGLTMKDVATNGLPTASNLSNDFLKRAARDGHAVSISPNTVSGLIGQYLADPTNNFKSVSAMSKESLSAGIGALTGLEDVNNAAVGMKGIDFDAVGEDGNMKHWSITSGDPGMGKALTINEDGATVGFLSSENTLANGNFISSDNGSGILENTGCLGLGEHSDIDAGAINSITSAENVDGYLRFTTDDGSCVAVVDKDKQTILQPEPIISYNDNGEAGISSTASGIILSDIQSKYPDYQVTSDIRYEKSSNTAYVELQKNGESKPRKLYVQDVVSLDTHMPEIMNSVSVGHRSNKGMHRTRYRYGFAKNFTRSKKS